MYRKNVLAGNAQNSFLMYSIKDGIIMLGSRHFFAILESELSQVLPCLLLHLDLVGERLKRRRWKKYCHLQFIQRNLENYLCCILKKKKKVLGPRFFANTVNYALKQVLEC